MAWNIKKKNKTKEKKSITFITWTFVGSWRDQYSFADLYIHKNIKIMN